MDDNTLQVILGRFDKLDNKIDGALSEQTNLRVQVAKIEEKLQPILDDALFSSRVQMLTHAVASAIGAGLVIAWRALWPGHVAPPSILK